MRGWRTTGSRQARDSGSIVKGLWVYGFMGLMYGSILMGMWVYVLRPCMFMGRTQSKWFSRWEILQHVGNSLVEFDPKVCKMFVQSGGTTYLRLLVQHMRSSNVSNYEANCGDP